MTADLTPYAPSSSLTPGRPLGLCPQSLDEALRLAEIMAQSDIVPKDFIGKPGNILVAIQWGAEIGMAPLQAMSHIAVINGRPALWGDALLAIVRGSGLLASFEEQIGADSATCTAQRRGEAPISRTFSREDAKQAGLLGKAGPWTQYPKRMLQMRARAWVLRDLFPDIIRGLHVAEEAQDLPVERAMGPAEVLAPGSGASRSGGGGTPGAGGHPGRSPGGGLMANYAKAILLGHLGRDPENRYLRDGTPVTHFSLATSRQRGTSPTTTWWRCACFGKPGAVIAQYARQGDPLLVEGEPTLRAYQHQGVERQALEVLVTSFAFVKGKVEPLAPAPNPPAASAAWEDEIPF